ncbi:hypothetical protein L1D15_21015 [Vibrio sp. Isolate25]|uniref:hypothetical protein n=1 Tax=Vibrio sp. Isolate25 TaxID=2908535 RepID=UPI001EFDFCFE|nr:hypothetical protein [Vibrio sp. Isolate25]MCG9599174.1 hypothetical protein [Vibrio sp. Isolate25]
MSIPNNPLKTDNQRLAALGLVGYRVYGGLSEFCSIVGSRLARALCFPFNFWSNYVQLDSRFNDNITVGSSYFLIQKLAFN